MRVMDIMLSIPSLVLTMALAAALGPSLFNAMLAIAIVRIPFYVRLARGQTLVVRQFTYVQAARTFGASRWHLISWHILRNPATADCPGLAGYRQRDPDGGHAGVHWFRCQQPTAEWGRWWL
jgi:peptide/nickel transport system permease protein